MSEERLPRPATGPRVAGPPERVRDGCPVSEARERLRRAGLRPTAQRCAIAWLLAGPTPRHVTPEGLYNEAVRARLPVSLASVYNIVRQFTEAGLLRQRVFRGGVTIYDTDVSDHQHFLVEGTQEVLNLPGTRVPVDGLPIAPEGFAVAGVELVVRLRPKAQG
jgi:Fur family transcriptional regulator, iron response regulator